MRGTGRSPAVPRAAPRPAGARLLRLYPAGWRTRYADEMLATLEQGRISLRGRLDLVRGAMDAWLHRPSRAPVVAALGTGGLWTVAGAGIVAQPAPPDWPGYLLEALPLAIVATGLGGLATIGCWARRSDVVGRSGGVAIGLAVIGHVAWTIALIVAWLGVGYGPGTMGAQALAVLGAILVGLVLVRAGDEWIGAILVIGPAVMLFGWPIAWLAFGFGWTLIGTLLLARPEPGDGVTPRAA